METDKINRYSNKAYHLQSIDPEFRAYIKQRNQINHQIHEHWKLELNIHVS